MSTDILDDVRTVYRQLVNESGCDPDAVAEKLYEEIFHETAGSGSAFRLLFAKLAGTTEVTDWTREHVGDLQAMLRATDEPTALVAQTPASVAEWMAQHRPEGVRISTGDPEQAEEVAEPEDHSLELSLDMSEEEVARIKELRHQEQEAKWAAIRAEQDAFHEAREAALAAEQREGNAGE